MLCSDWLRPQGTTYTTAVAVETSEHATKQWRVKQGPWQVYLPAQRYIPRPKFDVFSPNEVHQTDLLFLPHKQLPCGLKVFKCVLTIVDVESL